MVTLASDIVFVSIIRAFFISVFLLVLLLILRKVLRGKTILSRSLNFKTWYMLVIIGISFSVITLMQLALYSISAKMEISNVIAEIGSSTIIKVNNSFRDEKSYKNLSENSDITNNVMIDSLVFLLNKTKYYRATLPGAIATKDFVELRLFKDRVETERLVIIGGYILEVGQVPRQHRYICVDRELLSKVRFALKLNGN